MTIEEIKEAIDNKKPIYVVFKCYEYDSMKKYHYEIKELRKPRLGKDETKVITQDHILDSSAFNKFFTNTEDAEEYIKYGEVEKIETFPFVPYEELEDSFINFQQSDGEYKVLEINHISLDVQIDKKYKYPKIELSVEYDIKDVIESLELNRENYHKLLDEAIKMWKGEE